MTLATQSVPGDLSVSKWSGSEAVLQSAVRKAALRFVPLLTIAYLFNYLDRTSLGFAALTMNQQLGCRPVSSVWPRVFSFWAIRCLGCRAICCSTVTARGAGSPAS